MPDPDFSGRRLIEAELDWPTLRPVSARYPHVFFVRSSVGEPLVLKLRRKDPSRLLMLRNMYAFPMEARLHESLSMSKFECLEVPRFVSSDGRSFLLVSEVHGTPLSETKAVDRSGVARALGEFANAVQFRSYPWHRKMIDAIFFGMTSSIVRGLVKLSFKRGGIALVIRSIPVLTRLAVVVRKQSNPVLVHRDLVNSENSSVTISGKLALIDFGQVRFERRWVLLDAADISIDYAFNADSLTFRTCADELSKSFDAPVDLRDQMCLSLFRRCLHPVPSYEDRAIAFLRSVLVNKSAFDGWYSRNFSED